MIGFIMDKRGAESAISTVIWMVLGAILLILVVLFLFGGFKEPAKSITNKGKEFLANLASLSLTDKNSGKQPEVNKKKEEGDEKKAKEIYAEYQTARLEELKKSYLQDIINGYPNTNLGKIVKLFYFSDLNEFIENEDDVFVEIVKEKDYENLFMTGGLYKKKQDSLNPTELAKFSVVPKARARQAYTEIIGSGEDNLDLVSKAYMERAAIATIDTQNEGYEAVYLLVQTDENLKRAFKNNELYDILLSRLDLKKQSGDIIILNVKFQVFYPTLGGAVKDLEIMKKGDVKNFEVSVEIVTREESESVTLEKFNDFFRKLTFAIEISDFSDQSSEVQLCKFSHDESKLDSSIYSLVGKNFVGLDHGPLCDKFSAKMTNLGDFSSIPYPALGNLEFEVRWEDDTEIS